MWSGEWPALLRACFFGDVSPCSRVSAAVPPNAPSKLSQFDRPGGDFRVHGGVGRRRIVFAGRRARTCGGRALSFNYLDRYRPARFCWLEEQRAPAHPGQLLASSVLARAPSLSNAQLAPIENLSISPGLPGDYRSFELKSGDGDDYCKEACLHRPTKCGLDLCASRDICRKILARFLKKK